MLFEDKLEYYRQLTKYQPYILANKMKHNTIKERQERMLAMEKALDDFSVLWLKQHGIVDGKFNFDIEELP